MTANLTKYSGLWKCTSMLCWKGPMCTGNINQHRSSILTMNNTDIECCLHFNANQLAVHGIL